MNFLRFLSTLVLAGTVLAGPALAQENASVAAFRDWSVFNPSNPKECYIVSPPLKWEAQRGGTKVEVQRGDILLFVTIRPDDGVDKELSYTGGYPFRPGSDVEVSIARNVGYDTHAPWAEGSHQVTRTLRKVWQGEGF